MKIYSNISKIPITLTKVVEQDDIAYKQTTLIGYVITDNLLMTLDAQKKISDEATRR